MRKFRVKYYETVLNKEGHMYEELKEIEIECYNFKINGGIAIFTGRSPETSIASVSNFVLINEVK